MRLKELEIQGFKSFPDKTKIEIGEGITGVVGPNGSGKSNISDSIRWVLGETSSKQLRGSGKMEDVIFGGTQSRGAMGYASVALTIDNSDHGLDMDADEVTIGRRYYRSGESEYSINGQNVRLKDVYELLLDTGIGRDGYAIVGQGRIAEIVGAKSAERREIFEEASGIAKYRYRKNEAERRLDAAEGNLERLRDILGELEKRVGPLKRDSEKAQQFLELSEKRKTLEITLWVDAIRRANDSLRDQQRKYEAAQADYDRLSRQLDEFDEKSASLRAEAQQLVLAVEQANADIRAITEANAGSESEIAVLKNESEHSRFRIDDATSELERAGQGRESIEREAADHRAAIETLKSGMAGLDARVAELREALRALEEKAAASGERRDVIDAAMARLQDTATAARVSAASAQSAGEAAANRLAEAQRQAEELKAGAAATDEERRRAERRFKDAEEAVTRNDNIKAGLKLKLDSRRRQQAEAADNLQKADRERSAAAQRIHILEDLERNMDGYQQSVKAVMRAAGGGRLRGIIGPVAGIITVEKGYETAIETALGFALQNIVVEDQGCARAAIGFLKDERAGRATFLPLDTVQGSRFTGRLTGTAEVAADLVRTDPKYQHIIDNLLGRIIVVEDLTEASAVARNLGYRNRIVTLDGQVINAGGSFTGGSTARSVGVFSRKQELDELRSKLTKLEQKRTEAEKELAARKAEVLPYLEALPRELAIPILYVSHAQEEVLRLAQHIVQLAHGQVVRQGDAATLFNQLDQGFAAGNATAVLQGQLLAHHAQDHLSALGFAGGQLLLPTTPALASRPLGSAVRLTIAARDVSLSLQPLANTSLLNSLPATITGLREDGPGQVLAALAVGESQLLAHISQRSARQLALAPGQAVFAHIKGVALVR